MSDAKTTTIIPIYEVVVRFTNHFHPRGDFHTYLYADTLEAAERDFADAIKSECYSDVRMYRSDISFVGGLSQGEVGRKVVKKWREKKREVRT